ncbi:MAG: hypothetical protein DCC68_02270 [Planctomycetota bacterium]|nr:MAG: hypothetical protein DCC68_02270 [Planctomycetota bacterium]
MNARKLFARSAKWLLAGAIYVGCATSAQAVILGIGGVPTPGDPNLTAWFRADSGVTLNGATVAQWDDLSDIALNTNRDVTHPTAANQPTFIASVPALNNMPAIRFDGSNDFLRRTVDGLPGSAATGVPQPAVGNSDRTVFAVVNNIMPRPATNGIEHVLHWGSATNDFSYGVLAAAGGTRTFSNHYWGGVDNGSVASSARPSVVTFTYDNDFLAGIGRAGADRMWVNGMNAGLVDLQGTNTVPVAPAHQLKTGSNASAQFALGSRISGWSEGYLGDIAEVIIFDQALSDADRMSVEGYLSNRYGISFMPPSGTHSLPFEFNAGNAATAVNSLVFNGSAIPSTDTVDGAPVARIMPNINNQSGTVYLNKPVTLADDLSFSTQFEVRMNNGAGTDCCGDNPGADGVVFMLHQDPRGAVAAGSGGGGLGVAGVAPNTVVNNPTVGPAVFVELDTWHGGSWDVAANANTNGNHIAINTSGARFSVEQSAAGAIPQWTAVSNAPTRNVWVDYDGKTDMMDVYVSETNIKPASATISQRIDLRGIFTGNDVYLGFAGGTGGANHTAELRSWSFDSQESSSAPYEVVPAEFAFSDFTGQEGIFQFNGTGTAGIVDGRLRLTDNINNQAGSAMLNVPVALQRDFNFKTKFAFEISLPAGGGPAGPATNGPGADGLTFVLTTGPRGAAVVGGAGGAIGVDGISANFVAIELDTWGGGSFDGGVTAGQVHIGIDSSNNAHLGPNSVARAMIPRFNDGGDYFVWVEYDGATKVMDVFFSPDDVKPALPTLTTTVDLPALLGNAYDEIYAGFTAGTGGANNRHEILSWSLVPEPSTYVLVSMGVIGLFAARRRMKKA